METKIGRILNELSEDFSTTTTGMSFYDDSLDYSDYARETKENFSEVFMMSPDDYIDLCVYGFQSTGSNTSKDKLLSSRKFDKEDIERYKDIIQNETMDMPVLELQISDDPSKDLDSFGQEGLHRAIAAKELGIKQIPVLVMFRGKQGLKALRRFSKISNYKQITNNWTNYQWKNNFVDNASELYESVEENKFNDNFWKWFGNSKVVDKNGNPLVVYHGSRKQFDTFKPVNYYDIVRPNIRPYTFFSDDKNFADSYGGNNYLYSCYLKIENPYIVDVKGKVWNNILESTILADCPTDCDGIIIKNIAESHGQFGVANDYIIFNPNQIKSVDNNGEWSMNSNNIYENKSEDRLQQAMSLLNKVDGVISLDPSFFGKFGKTFDSKLDRVMDIKSPKTKLKRAIELLKNAQGSLIDEQFDDLNEMIDEFLTIQENKNMTKIKKVLSYLDEKEKSNISLSDRHTSVMKDFSKIAQDELSKANIDTNDNGIDRKELEKITDQDLEENDVLTPGQKSLAWEGFNDLKIRKPRLKSLADDMGDLAKETVIGTAHALTGGAFRKRRKVSESREHDENKTMALARYLGIDPSEIESSYDEFYTSDNTYIIYAEDEIMYAIDRMVTLDFEKYLPEIIKDLSANDFVELFCEFQDRQFVVDKHRIVNYGIDHNIVDIDDIYDTTNYNNSTFYIREK